MESEKQGIFMPFMTFIILLCVQNSKKRMKADFSSLKIVYRIMKCPFLDDISQVMAAAVHEFLPLRMNNSLNG